MTPHPLPARLDTAAAPALATALSARIAAGEPIALDGSAVEMLGQACLQVLASACRTAEARGLTFVVRGPSHALSEMCTLVGFDRLLAAA